MIHRNLLVVMPSIITVSTPYDNLSTGNFTELAVDVEITSISAGATYEFVIDRIGNDGIYYSMGGLFGPISSIGQNMASVNMLNYGYSLGGFIRIREVLSGVGASVTRSVSVIGKG